MERQKRTYHTEQRKQVLTFLTEHKGQQYTIDEVISHMSGEHLPGKSTVYRLMKQLVEEGLVKRCNKGNSRQFTYQLLDGEACSHHFHMQCESCGKLFHLAEEKSKEVQGFLQQAEQFDLDLTRCMLYGICGTCHHK